MPRTAEKPPENETKSDRFRRVASAKVGKALDAVKGIRSLADKSNYEYTEEQVSEILKAIEQARKDVASSFKRGKSGASFELS